MITLLLFDNCFDFGGRFIVFLSALELGYLIIQFFNFLLGSQVFLTRLPRQGLKALRQVKFLLGHPKNLLLRKSFFRFGL